MSAPQHQLFCSSAALPVYIAIGLHYQHQSAFYIYFASDLIIFIAWNSLKAKGCFSALTNTHIYMPNRFHDTT